MTRLAILVTLLVFAPFAAGEDERTKVRRTTLIVADIDASIAFYRDVLGFSRWYYNEGTVTEDSLPSAAATGDPSVFAIMKGADPWIGMVGLLQKGHPQPAAATTDGFRVADFEVSPGDTILMLETDDLDGIYARMQAAGTPIYRSPETTTVTGAGGRSWDATFLFAFDPDGHLLEINEPHFAADASATVRRGFADTSTGQLHYRYTPERDTLPLVLLHQTPLSGRMYRHLLPELASDRQVLAPDTPGYGESDKPAAAPELGDYSEALVGWLDAIGARRVDLFGYHTGAAIAVDVARRFPDRVRSLVLMSVPLFDADETSAWQLGANEAQADGAHLVAMWDSTWRNRAPGQTADMVAVTVAEKQRAGADEWWALGALARYPLAGELAALQQPLAVIAPGDGLAERSREAARLGRARVLVERDEWGYGIFDTEAAAIATLIESALRQLNDPQ